MGIFAHILENGGELEEPPENLTPEQRAAWFMDVYDDLADGAFFALAEEMDIDLDGFMDKED